MYNLGSLLLIILTNCADIYWFMYALGLYFIISSLAISIAATIAFIPATNVFAVSGFIIFESSFSIWIPSVPFT